LIEAGKYCDFTSEDHLTIQRRIDNAVKKITPADEYKDFSEKYKSLPVIFRFDDNPIDDNVGKLQPNQLTVDNLTVDWLRQKIVDLENSVKECQEKQQKVQNESNGKISSTSSLPTTPTTISQNSSLNTNNNITGSNNSLKDLK
jgi:tyrosine-protein kinase Fer